MLEKLKVKLVDDSPPSGNSSWSVGHKDEIFTVVKHDKTHYIVVEGYRENGLISMKKCVKVAE